MASGNASIGLPEVAEALSAVAETEFQEEIAIDWIEIRLLASGEVTYRFHERGTDEYEGGVLIVG